MRINREGLKKRVFAAREMASRCHLCPRRCGVNRLKGEVGFCRAGPLAKIYSYRQYLGEEPPISGSRGSGVIFFSHCTMSCVYCQNFKFSQLASGYTINSEKMGRIFLSLKKRGCHNINLVTPSHYLHEILESLYTYKEDLSNIPIVYNTSGYESAETLTLLKDIVDVYLTDMRYSDNSISALYSKTKDYVENNKKAIEIMHKHVGELIIDDYGVAKRGLIIRHLVIPNHLKNTQKILKYIAEHISKNTHISLMSQYLPLHKAKDFQNISRSLTPREYEKASAMLHKYGLENGWIQKLEKK